MRSATVVFPVPGLPVKHMCSEGDCACSPIPRRSRSMTSSAAMSRMRCLMGVSPMRSCSSSAITSSTWLSRSTSATRRGAAASSAGVIAVVPSASVLAAASTLVMIDASGRAVALAFRVVGCVGGDAVADRSTLDLLPREPESRLTRRAIDDEGHARGLPATRRIEGGDANVVVREGLAARIELHEHAGRILQVEHGVAMHFPVGVARVRVIGVLDADGPVVLERIVELPGELLVGEIRQERELPLGEALNAVGHHGERLRDQATVAVGTKSAVSVDS